MSDLFGETAPEPRKEAPVFYEMRRDIINPFSLNVYVAAGEIVEFANWQGAFLCYVKFKGKSYLVSKDNLKPYTPPPAPVTRIPTPRTVRPTSRAANKTVTELNTKERHQRYILEQLCEEEGNAWQISQGIFKRLNIEIRKDAIGKRTSELITKCFIERTGTKADTDSKCKAEVYRITEAGRNSLI